MEGMANDRNQLTLLFSTFGLTILLGILVTTSLFVTRPSVRNVGSMVSEIVQNENTRGPASLNVRDSSAAKSAVVMEQVSLPCFSDTSPLPGPVRTMAKQIRLHAKTCDKDQELHFLTIINKTNGYSATLFPADLQTLSTDYISIERGENILVLNQKIAGGQVRTIELRIQRSF